MTGATQGELKGLTILVVEDDFYQGTETREIFELAGADVVGPFSTVQAAIGSIEKTVPDCAVIDINLGDGPQFELARELKGRGIPTLFVSGYQVSIVPADLREFPHLAKPAERPAIVQAVRMVVSSTKAGTK